MNDVPCLLCRNVKVPMSRFTGSGDEFCSRCKPIAAAIDLLVAADIPVDIERAIQAWAREPIIDEKRAAKWKSMV